MRNKPVRCQQFVNQVRHGNNSYVELWQ